jgi:RecA/RadA recombinase
MSLYKKLSKSKALKDEIIPRDRTFEYISTGVLTMNLLFSGKHKGGILKGAMTMMSAPSQLGKSFIGLNILKNAQKKGMECIVLHTEKNFDFKWAERIGVNTDPEKLIVIETSNLTKLKQIVSEMIEGRIRTERENIFCLVDSWGSIVTSVQREKAASGSETRDMSESYWKNQLANIMSDSDATYFILNHVYDNLGGFGDPLQIPGGKRLYFNCNSVVLGASLAKDKDGTDITGDKITAKTHKGRGANRYTTLKYRIKQTGGLDLFYGLLEDAIEHGCVEQGVSKTTGNPKAGSYRRSFIDDDESLQEKKIYTKEFWTPIFKETDFGEWLDNKYAPVDTEYDVCNEDITEFL